jgi:hypothetical protein
MQRKTILILMVATGSALCWWPVAIQPNLGLPFWKTPLILIALITGLATALSDEGWRWLMIASVLGGFAGISCGYRFWWPADSIDASYAPFVKGLGTLASIPVSAIAVVAGMALRDSKIVTRNRRLIWGAFLVCFAFAPTVVALTPLLIALRK